ncbi:hypothetical protein [Paenibacillus sp. LjRoot56]|uniref:hypothetical protein n=1 Tax=Paenibacillus sp. LjRoot56 TaxID=3342333 RepID=UPI003ECFA264
MGKMANSIGKQMLTSAIIGTQNVKGDANSPVTTYFLSEEELEKYRALPAPRVEKKTNSRIW